MKKLQYFVISFTFVFVFACSATNTNEPISDTQNADNINLEEKLSELSIDGFYFAKRKESGVTAVDPPVFSRGEEVYLVLQNAGKFKQGDDSLNHVELHMVVTNSIGEIVIEKRNILGQKGVKKLKNDILKNPFASYITLSTEAPGTYHFKLTIIDLISQDSSVTEADYFLE